MKEPSSLQVHPGVIGFIHTARVFCGLVEMNVTNRNLWMRQMLVAIADLYVAAHYLPVPDLDPASSYPEDHFRLTPSEYWEVFQGVGHILEDDRFYAYCLDVTELLTEPQTPGVGDLADDLADIYRDIKPGLRAWDENVEDYLAEIIYDWKEPSFGSHWGRHAVEALRVLHLLVYA